MTASAPSRAKANLLQLFAFANRIDHGALHVVQDRPSGVIPVAKVKDMRPLGKV